MKAVTSSPAGHNGRFGELEPGVVYETENHPVYAAALEAGVLVPVVKKSVKRGSARAETAQDTGSIEYR